MCLTAASLFSKTSKTLFLYFKLFSYITICFTCIMNCRHILNLLLESYWFCFDLYLFTLYTLRHSCRKKILYLYLYSFSIHKSSALWSSVLCNFDWSYEAFLLFETYIVFVFSWKIRQLKALTTWCLSMIVNCLIAYEIINFLLIIFNRVVCVIFRNNCFDSDRILIFHNCSFKLFEWNCFKTVVNIILSCLTS